MSLMTKDIATFMHGVVKMLFLNLPLCRKFSTRLVHQPYLVEWLPHPKFLFDTLRGPGLPTRHSSKQIFFFSTVTKRQGIGNRFLYHLPTHLMFLRCIVVGSEVKAYYYIYHPVISSMFVFNK